MGNVNWRVVLLLYESCSQVDRSSPGVGGAGLSGGEGHDVHPPHLLQCGGLGRQQPQVIFTHFSSGIFKPN